MSKMGEYFMEKCETDPEFNRKVEEHHRQADYAEEQYFKHIEQESK